MTPTELANLLNVGTPCPPVAQAVVQQLPTQQMVMVPPTYSCEGPRMIPPTGPVTAIDPANLVTERCGSYTFGYINSGSGATAVNLNYGFDCFTEELRGNLLDRYEPFATETPGVLGTAPFYVDPQPSAANLQLMNCLAADDAFIYNQIDVRIDAGADTSAGGRQLRNPIRPVNVNVANNFAVCENVEEPPVCPPCPNQGGVQDRVIFQPFALPHAGKTGFFYRLEAGVDITIKHCIALIAVPHFKPCATLANPVLGPQF